MDRYFSTDHKLVVQVGKIIFPTNKTFGSPHNLVSCSLSMFVFSYIEPVSSLFSLKGWAAGLRQQVSGSEENHSAAADWTPAALQQSRDGGSSQHHLLLTTRGQRWPTHALWLQVRVELWCYFLPCKSKVSVSVLASSNLHVKVSLSNTLSPELPLMHPSACECVTALFYFIFKGI